MTPSEIEFIYYFFNVIYVRHPLEFFILLVAVFALFVYLYRREL